MPHDSSNPGERRELPSRWLAGCLVFYWLAHVAAFHWPMGEGHGGGHPLDLIVHGTAYAVLGWLLVVVVERHAEQMSRPASERTRRLLLCWLTVILYGLLDETTQPLTGRDFDLLDWAADIVGSGLGILVYRAAAGLRHRVD